MKEEKSVPQRFNEKCFYYDKFGHGTAERRKMAGKIR